MKIVAVELRQYERAVREAIDIRQNCQIIIEQRWGEIQSIKCLNQPSLVPSAGVPPSLHPLILVGKLLNILPQVINDRSLDRTEFYEIYKSVVIIGVII